jgi:hypothetical protein
MTELTITPRQVSPLQNYAEQIVIEDQTSLDDASDHLSRAKALLKQVVTYKESKTKPLNVTLALIRDETRPLEDALKQAITAISDKMTVFGTRQLIDRKATEDAIAARVAPGRGNLSLDTASKRIEALPELANTAETASGSLQFVPHKTFKVMNVVLLANHSAEYVEPNMVAIRKAMYAGIENLPGVLYTVEMRPKTNLK